MFQICLQFFLSSSLLSEFSSYHFMPLLILRKKKKVTTHWRSFIQPLMWRCRWTELQIKKLQSQAQQYDRELEAYNKGKQIQLDNSTPTDGVKSLPFSQINPRGGVLKRKKRKRVEATSDVTAYISHHNLFSYYGIYVSLLLSHVIFISLFS